MRIPRKNSDTLIVLGGKSGAFWFGFYASLGVITASMIVLGTNRTVRQVMGWLGQWWGA